MLVMPIFKKMLFISMGAIIQLDAQVQLSPLMPSTLYTEQETAPRKGFSERNSRNSMESLWTLYQGTSALSLLLAGEGQELVSEKVVHIYGLLGGIACLECDTSAGCPSLPVYR